MPDEPSPVLITGSRAPVALALARTLTAAGFPVYTGDSVRPTLGQFSRAAIADLALPPPRFLTPEAYIAALGQIVRRYGIRAILPTCEETFYLARIASRLFAETGVRVACPPLPVLETLHDKLAVIGFARQQGIAVPPTHSLGDGGADPWRDAVLKRTHSRFGEHIVRLRPGDLLTRSLEGTETANRWLWQEWVSGRSVSSYSLCDNGAMRCHVAYVTPYALAGGAGVFYESVDGTASLAIAKRLAAATGYTGQLSLDFIEDARGDLWLIECNPRATMGLCLLTDEPRFALAWRDILGGRDSGEATALLPPGRSAQVRLATLIWGGRSRASDRSLIRWGRDLIAAPDVLARGRDCGPLLGQVRVLSAFHRQAKALGCSLTAVTTRDIEWNGEEAASRDVEKRLRPPLLEAFPELAGRFPWTPLLSAKATPVLRSAALSRRGDGDVWIKRDDLACPRYGGNKARKFEWILGDLRAKGYRELWTVGGLCSNHCTAAAVYGARANVPVRLFFTPTPLDEEERDLLRVQMALGAKLAMLPPRLRDLLSLLAPRKAYLAPPGGSSVPGVLGYVDAGLELAGQVTRGECPRPDVIYIAAASRGTVLGLAMGLRLSGMEMPHIVAVETVTPGWQRSRLLLPTPALALRRLRSASPAARRLLPDRIASLDPFADPRFEEIPLGAVTPEIRAALRAGPEETDIALDAHFSAKAYAALRADLAAGLLRGKTVLFWQTHGGIPESERAALLAAAPPLPADVAYAAAQWLREGQTS